MVLGSRYAAPGADVSTLAFGSNAPNAHFRAAQGNLLADENDDLTVPTRGATFVVPPNADKLSLMWDSRSGMLTGSFIHAVTNKPVQFRGVALHKSNYAAGYFLGPTESGWVMLSRK